MRVSTKITASSGLFVLLIAGVLTYNLSLVRSLARVHSDSSSVSFRAALLALELIGLTEELEESAKKFHVAWDVTTYSGVWNTHRDELSRKLDELAALDHSPPVDRTAALLDRSWAAFRASRAFRLEPPALPDSGEPSDSEVDPTSDVGSALLEERLQHLSNLERGARAVLQTSRQSIAHGVEMANAKRRQAEQISFNVAVAALLLIVLVSFLTARSIKAPLRRFTGGARAVTDGNLHVQLDDSGHDEFAPPAAAFNSMVRRLGDLERLKQDFLAHVSHELKTPIVAMQETNALLLEQLAGPLNPQQQRVINLNLESARRLSAMISNLLDLSRMEAGALEYEFKQHDLLEMVDFVCEELESRKHEKGLWLEADLSTRPVMIYGDRDRLIQVLENLYENAVKFSTLASTLGLSVSKVSAPPDHLPERWRRRLDHRRNAQCVLLAVSDSGPGVPDTHKDLIFEKFHQVEKAQKQGARSGVGLGLAISREIVEAHRGALWVRDNPEGGSIFYLLLPTDPRTMPPLPAAPQLAAEAH